MKAAQASTTAKVIAASTLLLDSDARTAPLVAPGAAALCRQMLSGNRADRWLAWSAVHPLTRALWRAVEWLTLPGIMSHYWHRKRWIETRCRAAVGEGFSRVIVLGAGLDTLGLRLARELAHVEVIEVDHPATQHAKRRALQPVETHEGVDTGLPPNLHFVPCDFGAGALPLELLSDSRPTMFVVEGVLMYLPPAAIDRLFTAICKARGNCSRVRVVFSFMSIWPDGRSGFRPYSRLVEHWLAWRREPFTWALEPAAMQYFLAIHRFRMLEMAMTPELRDVHGVARRVPAASMLEGENLVVCEPVAA